MTELDQSNMILIPLLVGGGLLVVIIILLIIVGLIHVLGELGTVILAGISFLYLLYRTADKRRKL